MKITKTRHLTDMTNLRIILPGASSLIEKKTINTNNHTKENDKKLFFIRNTPTFFLRIFVENHYLNIIFLKLKIHIHIKNQRIHT